MDKIQFAIQQLRADPNNNKYTDEELMALYGLNQPSFNQGKTGILNNISFPEFNLPTNLGDIKNLGGKIMGGVISAATGIPFFGPLIGNIAQPAVSDVIGQNYMAQNYGLDNIGRIRQGDLMQGYNPISGGGLYTLTGGRLGQEPTIGLDRAYQKRIDTIRNVGIPRLLRAGKDPSNLKKRLDDLIARQAKDNAAVQLIKLANASTGKKQTIDDFRAGKINVGMPEQSTGGAGPNAPTQTFAAPTQQGQSPRGMMTTGADIPDRGRNR